MMESKPTFLIVSALILAVMALLAGRTWRKAHYDRGLKGSYEIRWRLGMYVQGLGLLSIGVFMPLYVLLRDPHSPMYHGSSWSPASITVAVCLVVALVVLLWGFWQQKNAAIAAIDERAERASLEVPGAPPDIVD